MADEDFVDFDQEWFFDELKGDQTEGTTLDPPLPPSPPPPAAASSSTNNHGSINQSHPPVQQQIHQPPHQNNAYQEQQMGHRDGMMPSTSTYGMQQQQQQHQPLQEQQQVPVTQNQQIHIQQQVHQQTQQQFETLQTYNPNQQNQNIQNHYQQNSQQMIFDMEMDYLSNEASTSSAMPMECRISQEYSQPQQYQPQQQQQCETQWIQMEQPSLMTQQHPQQMASVVYTSTSQQMPRIPDPGGQHTNQPQILNNYNPQQTQHIIQTGINGQTMLASMQPVQRIIPQQQQFELNSNNFMQQQVAYIDHTGSQQFITSQTGEVGNVNFHQMQVIPQIVPIQPAPAAETPAPAPIPPPTKAKATKNTSRAKKKNQPPPPPSQAPAEGDSILSKIEKTGSVAVNFNDNPEKSAKMAQLMGMMASLAANEAQGYDVSEARSSLEKQLEELLTGANIIPQPTAVAPPPKPASTYTPIAPNANVPSTSTPTPQQPKTKKGRTKAEQQQNLQQKKAANAAANANINSKINANIQPIQQQQPQQQPQNDSGCRIISQDANYLIVESNGTIMKAVNVRTENGTATYQILGPVDEQTLYQLKQSQQQPPPQQPPQSQHQQKRVQPIQPSTFKAENDEVAPAAVLDVVNSLSSSSKSKTQKKTPAKSKSKKVSEPPLPPAVEQKPVVLKEQEVLLKPKPEPTVICVPSASKEPPKPKILFPPIAVSAKRVKDKTDSRKRRIAEWIKKMKEVIATTDINSPFIDKEDVFNRLMPYGFHYEPDLSQKTMEKLEHELVRHQTHLYDRYKSIEGKMQQIFIRDTTRQNFDLEKNMLLAIDAEYERQQLEKDKALFQTDPYQFIRQSDVVKTPALLNDDYITETRRLLNLNKPKNLKPTKGFHFEPSNFNENEFIERKNKLVEEDEERERKEKLAAFKKAHPPPPIQKPPPKPVPPIQTPKPSIEPVKINLKLQPNTVPLNKETQKLKRPPVEFTSTSESSSSDDDYEKRSKSSKSKKSKSFQSPSPQKERKSKSPQKSKHIDSTISKEKANRVPTVDKLNNKHQPPIKTTLRKPMPPELNAFYPSMNLSGYKIPKIGDPTPPPMPQPPIKSLIHEPVQRNASKSVEPMQEFLKPEEPQDTVPKTATKPLKVRMTEFLKPQEPWKAKEDVVRVKENTVETLKIKYSSVSHNMDKVKKEKHHHHHSSKNSERSNSVISNHTHKSSNNIERSGSLNSETTTKVPSLVIKPPQKFKHPNDIKKEEKQQSKEKEKSSSSKDKAGISIKIGSIPSSQKDTVKTEEKSLKTKIEIPKSENLERPIPQQPLKLKINFGSKKPAGSPSTINSIKESIPSPNNLAVEHKKKDKKDKHSKEFRKEKKVAEKEEDEALPVLEIMEQNINDIREADEDEAAKEAKRIRKEEKKRQKKAEKKQKKLEKKQRKQQKEEEETVKAATPKITSPGGDHLRLKLSIKKPVKPVEAVLSHPPSPPPKLEPEIAPFEITPKLKFTISRNILPESSKNSKKEKDRNLKRESPKIESEPNLEAPPLKIPRVKIKLGGSQNLTAASSSSSSSAAAAAAAAVNASTSIPHSSTATPTTSAPVIPKIEKKNSIVEKQIENSENTVSSLPLQQQHQQSQTERPSMVGQPPTATIEKNATATPAKIRRIKKSKHGGSGFSDCSDVEETQVDLRLMTDRILSRCRD